MTRIALSVVLALTAFAPSAAGRAPQAAQCPRIIVNCPADMLATGPVTFMLSVEGAIPLSRLTFTWAVSGGVITSGQSTQSITVDPTGINGQTLTATVDVEGLPAACPKSASCSTSPGCSLRSARKIDEYGDLSLGDEQARLDNFAVELQNDPTAQGYVMAYGGRRGRAGEAQARADRARDYLVKTHAVDSARVVVIDGGHREELTVELFIVPAGVTPPESTPTVETLEVERLPEEPGPPRPARRKPRPRS